MTYIPSKIKPMCGSKIVTLQELKLKVSNLLEFSFNETNPLDNYLLNQLINSLNLEIKDVNNILVNEHEIRHMEYLLKYSVKQYNEQIKDKYQKIVHIILLNYHIPDMSINKNRIETGRKFNNFDIPINQVFNNTIILPRLNYLENVVNILKSRFAVNKTGEK